MECRHPLWLEIPRTGVSMPVTTAQLQAVQGLRQPISAASLLAAWQPFHLLAPVPEEPQQSKVWLSQPAFCRLRLALPAVAVLTSLASSTQALLVDYPAYWSLPAA